MAEIRPVPDSPDNDMMRFAFMSSSVKPATPDLILIQEEEIPIDIVTALLFEDIGSIEVLSISRSDIINGRDIDYGLLPRPTDLSRRHSPVNIFRVAGTLSEFFNNFAIKLRLHIPENGTGPEKLYVGAENSFGCSGFPVLNAITDELIDCFQTISSAQNFIKDLNLRKDIVYVDPENGNLVVDVINLKKDNQVEIELLVEGTLEDDTIY